MSEGCRSVDGTINPDAATIIQEDKQVIKGIGTSIAAELEKLTNLEVRVTVLGYLQRGGNPSPLRLLTTRLGWRLSIWLQG